MLTYKKTIEYLYTQLPMFSRVGAVAYKADLHNTIELCKNIGNPQQKIKCIHIAGTNGKGSTSHILASIFQAAGYKTGLYTSPHIKDFRERIRLNGKMIEEHAVIDFVEKTKVISDEIKPSFFELTVAMAFDYFAQQNVDIAIIETGLGGLLDSTNVIMPILSIITNIGFDHQNILGNTLQEIATQKAGIIKENIPVVIGETLIETKNIFVETALLKNAPIYFAENKYQTIKTEYGESALNCMVKNIENKKEENFKLDLTGLYQAKNICTILMAIDVLQDIGYTFKKEEIIEGLAKIKSSTGLRGRWDVLQNNPTIITDVAHNKDGISQVLFQLKICYPKAKFHFIVGFVNDKDVDAVLKLFPKEANYYFTNAHIPRAMPKEILQIKANENGLLGNIFDDVNEALFFAKQNSNEDEVILICGSFFIISEIINF